MVISISVFIIHALVSGRLYGKNGFNTVERRCAKSEGNNYCTYLLRTIPEIYLFLKRIRWLVPLAVVNTYFKMDLLYRK